MKCKLYLFVVIILLCGCGSGWKGYIKSSKTDVLQSVSIGDHIDDIRSLYGRESFITKMDDSECKSGNLILYNYKSFPADQVDADRGFPDLVIFLTCEKKVTEIWFRY